MNNVELSGILERAADVVDERGYFPPSFDCKEGVCEVGALYLAVGGRARRVEYAEGQVEQVEQTVNEACYALHGRKWRDVCAVDFQDRHFHRDGQLLSRKLREVAAKLIQDDQDKAERKEEAVAVA